MFSRTNIRTAKAVGIGFLLGAGITLIVHAAVGIVRFWLGV